MGKILANGMLKKLGLKVTVPRITILRILTTMKARHLSAEDIYRKISEQGYDIGLATVYRVLTKFESAGLVIRHNFEGDHSMFELDKGEHHDHIVCIKCGNVEEFVDMVIEERQMAIAKQCDFLVTDHALYIYGTCHNCNSTTN